VPSVDETLDCDRGGSISAEKLEDSGEFVPSAQDATEADTEKNDFGQTQNFHKELLFETR
jgi:hypothetical protein